MWRRREWPAGPERPTFTERAICSVPLPYPLACLLLAALVQTPGILLANLLDIGDMDRAVKATFGNALQNSGWYAGFFAAFTVGFYFLMFYLVRYSRLGLAAASRDIVPLVASQVNQCPRPGNHLS